MIEKQKEHAVLLLLLLWVGQKWDLFHSIRKAEHVQNTHNRKLLIWPCQCSESKSSGNGKERLNEWLNERKSWQEPSFILIQEDWNSASSAGQFHNQTHTHSHIPAFNAIIFNSFYIEWEIGKEIHYVVCSLSHSRFFVLSFSAKKIRFFRTINSLYVFLPCSRDSVHLPFIAISPLLVPSHTQIHTLSLSHPIGVVLKNDEPKNAWIPANRCLLSI